MSHRLLDIAPRADLQALQRTFAQTRRIQIRDVLTPQSAAIVHRILARETPWGLAWQAAGSGGARYHRQAELAAMATAEHQTRIRLVGQAMVSGDYGFAYSCYPITAAYGQWDPDGPHDMLLEYINDAPVMDLVRAVTGLTDLAKADAQATLYAPGQFLGMHDDSEETAGRRIAYVLNLCQEDWRPDWGGYLQFYDDDGNVTAGYRPRFNALNLFAVPQRHNVTPVPPYAPIGRFAITGWFRDR